MFLDHIYSVPSSAEPAKLNAMLPQLLCEQSVRSVSAMIVTDWDPKIWGGDICEFDD